MDIHKPKAVHNWRELLKEIGIIVIGVVIALSAEQVVDTIHWMRQVSAGEDVLKGAFVEKAKYAALRDVQSDCIAKRLAFLSAILQRASEDGKLPPIGAIGHPPFTPWSIGSWDGLVASQTISHLPRQKLIDYSIISQRTIFLSGLSDREEAQWTLLGTMSGPGRRLSDAESEQLRIVLAEASDSNDLMHRNADRLRDSLLATGLVAQSAIDDAVGNAMHDRAKAVICRPIAGAAGWL
jgi:hypothetical protein